MNDSIQTTVSASPVSGLATGNNVWLYVSAAELLVILFLCLALFRKRKPKSERQRLKDHVMSEGDIDFGNIIDSSFKAKSLCDQLKKVCHPDLFAKDEEKNRIATEIFALLMKNKHNYAELCRLRERAINELGIKL